MSTVSTDEPYSAFSGWQKVVLVTITATCGMLSPLSANIYFPALTAIQLDFGTTTELINLTVTVYMIFQGVSPAFWGSLADVWGRRPVYLGTILVYIGTCIGLALAPSYAALLVLRMLQAFGSSSVVAIGAGVVGDIATPAERGTYFGVFSCAQMLGPVIGPVLGGIIAELLTWRWIFWLLLIIGGVLFVAVLLFLPETLRSLVGNGSGYANPTPIQWLKRKLDKSNQELSTVDRSRKLLKFPNPVRPMLYLLQPDVFVALLFNALHYAVYYCYLTSTPSLFASLYQLNELQVGLCFLVPGLGCVIGSLCEGRILDHDFRVIMRKGGISDSQKNSGKLALDFPIFKARLRTAWIHAMLIQVVTIIYGWCLYIDVHLAVPLVLQFIVGFCVTSLFNVFQTLAVDLFPGKGASITASNNFIRCLLGAAATVAIEPGIQSVNVGWMYTILGLLLVVSNSLFPVLLKFGPRWRKNRMDRETAEKNVKDNESS
ncbi:major facilitator superfamily domain-containing protein [Fennellomyces sp. T-0311]|nr:major facilitator superfamily domain-containing protein [Fennellomyces sp. T-0311]